MNDGTHRHDTARPMAGADLRGRSAAEIAEQLIRDATSLELTGASFAKDEAFYKMVAANVREAASFLALWQANVEAIHGGCATKITRAHIDTRLDCIATVSCITDSVRSCGAASAIWHNACRAIGDALHASLPGEVRS